MCFGDAVLHVRNLSLIGEPLRLLWCAFAVSFDQRSTAKKPLPGYFLQNRFKFPRSGERR